MTSRKEVKIFCLLLSLVLTLLIFSSAEGVWYSKASSLTFLEVLENNLEISTYVHIQRSDDNGYLFEKWNDPKTTCSAVHPKDSSNETDACLDEYGGVVVKKVGSGEDASYYIYPQHQIVVNMYPGMGGMGSGMYGGMYGIYSGMRSMGGVYGSMGGMYGSMGGVYGGMGGMYGGMSGGITPYSGLYGATGNYAAGYGGISPYGGLFGGLSGLFGLSGSLYGTHPVDPFSGIPGRLDGGNWNIAANQYNPSLGPASPGASFLPNSSQPAFSFGQQNGSFLSPMAPLLSGTLGGALPLFTGLNTSLPNVLPYAINASAEPTRNAQFFSPFRPQFPNIPNRNPSFLNRAFPW